ncbi:asparagine synthase (glutamine-hydrolyzing) [Nostoc sp. CHAB 5784]|uniref:asparagine synthase (glutamine-hydrolyzing) n=1 Tax=Nostoc mirabile TaxID=2907820 RepID=UPI001E30D626|nr:asparagine synthase (glutamine-hydrolyzing) [Nostoc mirabile]MCC5664229.1 asparagine synthase (glutamine-hydrolyzing) [Nostoc mirabile CHAB5784]
MCGISGVIYKERNRCVSEKLITDMTNSIKHRGPDDEGLYIDGSVGLGHRRLSILDLSASGHQPMPYHNERFWIVYNGEIYNYLEIREELKHKGHQFYTGTDTEVVLAAYCEWGANCLHHFNGMWAFAIYDRANKELFFSRDRFGVKPFYYINDSEKFVFASEIKALVTVFPEYRKPNLAYIHHFLPSGSLDDGEETFFVDIKALQPGHYAYLHTETGNLQIHSYWELDTDKFRQSWHSGDPIEQFRHLLSSSVKMQMRSDVPVGTCLSGGLDSSSIVCLASKFQESPIYTFSGLYSDKDCDERSYVDSVNSLANTIPHPVFPEPSHDLINDLQRIVWHQDEPSAGPGLYTQYYVMKEARKHVKVLLDGQGSDELFAGYLPYFALRIKDLLVNNSKNKVWGTISAYQTAFEVTRYWGMQWINPVLSNLVNHRLIKLANRITNIGFKTSVYARLSSEEPSFFSQEFEALVKDDKIQRFQPICFPEQLANTLYWHLVQQSIPALLHYEDRNSMAFSIEARVPFLDHRIVEFALSLDSNYKIRGSWTKWILRQAMQDLLPREVTWRRSKLGYPTPFARWIRTAPHKNNIYDIICSESFINRNIVPRNTIEFYWQQHQEKNIDRSWLIYRWLTLELWYRQFIDNLDPHTAVF